MTPGSFPAFQGGATAPRPVAQPVLLTGATPGNFGAFQGGATALPVNSGQPVTVGQQGTAGSP